MDTVDSEDNDSSTAHLPHEDEESTRGYELYLIHILLLLQAAPFALRGIIRKMVTERNGNLAELMTEKKYTFENSYKDEFKELFRDDLVNTNIDSWDTQLLCVVILVLFHPETDLQQSDSASQKAKFEAVENILAQKLDLNNYVQSASLDFKTFESKQICLRASIMELIKDIDNNSRYECKRMIHSYNPGSIRITSEVMRDLKKAHDNIDLQFEIALQNMPYHGNQGKSIFTKTLQDKCVYADDAAIFTCKLNTSLEGVTWRHNYQTIRESDTLKIVKDGNWHWLAICCVKQNDAGLYSCACCGTSSSANLSVLNKSLMMIEDLHVATEEDNVKENMDIVLLCRINMHTTNVSWRHNNHVIHSNRHHVAFQDNIHILTIRKAQYEDEGDYTVDFGTTKSSTTVILKANLNVEHRLQLTNDLYTNWVRSSLGLKYLKLGLEDVSRSIVRRHHTELLTSLSSIGLTCTQCTTEELRPAHLQENCPNISKCICSKQLYKRTYCPNGRFCSNFFDKVMFDHRSNDLCLKNTDMQKWANDPWSVAKCYINTPGYHDKSSEKEIDCSGLLSLFINNTFFERSLKIEVNGETDVFKKAKDSRNDIFHSANYELSKSQTNDYLDLFISVLEVKAANNGMHPLSSYLGTKVAIANLNQLRKNEIEIRLSGQSQKLIQELKEHAMNEIAEKVDEATKQNKLKLQHLEQRLTDNEKEFHLMRGLRSSHTKRENNAESQVVFKLDLHLQVIAQTGERSTQGSLRIFHSMNYYHSDPKMKQDQYTSPTDVSVQRLLEYIKVLENCRIGHVSHAENVVVITVNCFTCEAIETFLKSTNGKKFQQEIMELRKCLEVHEHMKIYDVTASCSSESLENTRKSLSKHSQIKHFTCEKHILECTWYCFDHDKFVCPKCKDADHGLCDGLKQVISSRYYREQKQSLVLKRVKEKFCVRIKHPLVNKSDNDVNECDITSIRMLPNGEILLIDLENRRLKKLNRKYTIVSHCDLPDIPFDVCYIGNGRAAVSLGLTGIQVVTVLGNMKCEQIVELDHKCYSLACHGETLYVGDGYNILRYNTDCQHKYDFYTNDEHGIFIPHIAVSDDGEKLYIAQGIHINRLVTIDKEGNILSKLTTGVAGFLIGVCVVGDGTVFVAETPGGVYQVDYSGRNVLGTVVGLSSGLHRLSSLCFDRLTNRLLVACQGNFITVVKLKMYST